MANDRNWSGLFVNGRGGISVGVVENGSGAPLNDTRVVHPSVRTKDGANRLKVIKTGNRLRFFVNDRLVHEQAYRPFFGPGIGVAAISGPIVAAFDDLEVEGSPAPGMNR